MDIQTEDELMNITTEDELMTIAESLNGRTFEDINPMAAIQISQLPPSQRRGMAGTFIEGVFGITTNSSPEPDFPHIGIELKTVPFKIRDDDYIVPKERCVLSKINYTELLTSTFGDSHLYHKIRRVLVMPYLHNDDFTQNRILHPFLWEADTWLDELTRDWNIMQEITLTDRLSEGSTTFLASCPKHGGGWNRSNPELSHPRSLAHHPLRPYVEHRGYCIKQNRIAELMSRATGLPIVRVGRTFRFPMAAFGL